MKFKVSKFKKWSLTNVIYISFILLFSQNIAAACNWSCDIRADYPCPTWREPFRVCEGHTDDPICISNRMACKGTLTTCVGASLVAYGVTSACVSSVVGVYVSSGTTWAEAALTCGLAAETIHIASKHCE